MQMTDNEEELLRSVALQNARAVLLARERAELELVRAKEELERSNQRVTSILESITDGFFALDQQWRFTYLNRRGEEILRPLRKSKNDLLGRVLWEELPTLVGTAVEESYRRAIDEQVTVEFEGFYEPLNAWFEARVYPSPEGLSVYLRDVTRRKESEARLREQYEWFQVTLASIADAVITTDTECRITFLNSVAEAMTGWKGTEAAGRALGEVFNIINEEDRRPATNPVEIVLREGKAVELANSTLLISRDRRESAIEDTAAPIRDAHGKVAGAVMVFHDVSERRRVEEARRASEQRLRATFNQASVGMAVASLDGRFEEVNERFSQILGYSSAELYQRTFADVTHPDDRSETMANVQSLLDGARSDYVQEKRYIRKDGETVWSRTSVTLLKNAKGFPERFVGVIEDVTERKRAEESRFRLAAVVESSDDAIISMGFDATVTTWNRAAEKMFGYTDGEMIGQSINLIIPPDRQEEEPGILERLKRGERVEHYETIRSRKDGSLLNVSLTVSPILDSNGRIVGASKISRDITDRIRVQEALREETRRLEREIAERKKVESALREAQEQLSRHAHLLEDQVAERTSKLREKIGELEAFSYSVSHDMRAPLRAMQGYSDALLEEYTARLDETAVEYLKRIRRSASRMDLLIQDVLAYSKISKGDIALRKVDAEGVIRDILQNYPALRPEKAKITLTGPFPAIWGHEAYLTQIVSNILSNAIKFVSPGTFPEIVITATQEETQVRLSFADNGIGIAPQHQQQIFQIFGRVYSEKEFEGTGIGLAIAKKAAERMGGSIGVVSQVGRGSEFFVLLKPAS
jgi:PAS domain S-box-containing protein